MANETELKTLRDQLITAMGGSESHIDFDSAVADFPVELQGTKPDGVAHSAWELIEHLRITQRDILDFSRGPEHYKALQWPKKYWPQQSAPPNAQAWDQSVEAFKTDRAAMEDLIEDNKVDLFEPFAHASGQNLLREALLLANHNSYHLGQIVFLKRMLTGK